MGINPRNLRLRPKGDPISTTIGGFIILAGTAFGAYIDLQDRNRYLYYRDKSAMFGKEKNEGDPPSWGSEYWNLDKFETLRRK